MCSINHSCLLKYLSWPTRALGWLLILFKSYKEGISNLYVGVRLERYFLKVSRCFLGLQGAPLDSRMNI